MTDDVPAFSVCQYTTFPLTFEQDVALYRELGIEGIEVCEEKLSPDPGRAREQLAMLAEHLIADGAKIERVRDPGGTAVGDRIRELLLSRENADIGSMCEVMLFMASRAQLVEERIRPALDAGRIVLCDRFISATIAYQGASGVPTETILEVGRAAVGGSWPDLTIILDVPAGIGMRRIGVPRDKRKKADEPTGQTLPLFGDRLESRHLEYDQTVRANFLKLCSRGAYPRPVVRVDAKPSPKSVFKQILGKLSEAFSNAADEHA